MEALKYFKVVRIFRIRISQDLTQGLLPKLKRSTKARVLNVNVTGGDAPAKIDKNNLQAERGFKGL